MSSSEQVRIETQDCVLTVDIDEWKLSFQFSDLSEPVIESPCPLMLFPEIVGAYLVKGTAQIEFSGYDPAGRPKLVVSAEIGGSTKGRVWNEVLCVPDRLVCTAEYECESDHSVAHWCVAAPGAKLGADGVHAYIGEPHLETNGQVFPLDDIDISTASHNWSYFPLVPRVILKRGLFSVCTGGTSLANDFGMELKAKDGVVEHFRFNYGGESVPLALPGGHRHRGPRLQTQVTLNLTDDQAHGAFTQAMIDDGIVPEKRFKPEDDVWLKPWYCTWGDQWLLAKKQLGFEHGPEHFRVIKQLLTQEFVLKAAKKIREEELNIGTIIIDEGWQTARGDWELVTEQFPDMRGLVDELHAMDFKVALWWSPFHTDANAEILKRPDMLAGPSKHGFMWLDYTNPNVRDWIGEKFEKWFGNGPGQWDIDGIKLDYIAEKNYAKLDPVDLDWYGEERALYQVFKMVYDAIAKHKPSPYLWGQPFNSHHQQFFCACCGEESFKEYVTYMYSKLAMRDALCPGQRVTTHFNYHAHMMGDYLRMMARIGGIPQIGLILDPAVTPEIMAEMRQLLSDNWS